jgi:hypothetical protein
MDLKWLAWFTNQPRLLAYDGSTLSLNRQWAKRFSTLKVGSRSVVGMGPPNGSMSGVAGQ